MRVRSALISFVAALAVLSALGLAAFLKSGIYDIAAVTEHLSPERFLITVMKKYSVNKAAMDIELPNFEKIPYIKKGAKIYVRHCEVCHGGPGQAREKLAKGLNPNPPPLVKVLDSWSKKEVYWIIHSGLKMAGMPGFGETLKQEELFAVSAFVLRLNTLPPKDYKKIRAWSLGKGAEPNESYWRIPDQGWNKLKSANQKRGKSLLGQYGCGSCHVIPGVAQAQGQTGPPLNDWGRRHYIAGSVVNYPDNLIRWILDPETLEEGTLMPELGVSPQDALDMAAYLYTL